MLSLQGCACGSFLLCLLQLGWSGLGVFLIFIVSQYGLFEWFLYVVDVSYGVHSVVVRGVLTLYKFYASPSYVIGVFNKFSMSISYVSNGFDDVWFVVLWSFMFR